MTHLWIRCALVFLVALIARVLMAEVVDDTPALGRARRLPPVLSSAIPSLKVTKIRLSFGSGLSVQQETAGWAIPISIMARVQDSPLYWGLDTGVNFWDFHETVTSMTQATGVPMLLGVTYEGDQRGVVRYHPFIGIATGPHFLRQSGMNSMQWQVMARGGVHFDVAESFSMSFDTRFGMLGSNFVLLPQLSASLNL